MEIWHWQIARNMTTKRIWLLCKAISLRQTMAPIGETHYMLMKDIQVFLMNQLVNIFFCIFFLKILFKYYFFVYDY